MTYLHQGNPTPEFKSICYWIFAGILSPTKWDGINDKLKNLTNVNIYSAVMPKFIFDKNSDHRIFFLNCRNQAAPEKWIARKWCSKLRNKILSNNWITIMSNEDIKCAQKKKKTLWSRDKLQLSHMADVLSNDRS